MKNTLYALAFTAIFTTACGNSYDKERAKEDSAAINSAPPDSGVNNLNNQNANGGFPAADTLNKFDSSIKKY